MIRKNKGITLIALIVTIIVMLVLVAVTVSILVESDLIGSAEKAGDAYKSAYEQEQTMSQITVGNKTYASLNDYMNNNPITGENPETPTIDYESILATAQPHPNQEGTDKANDIGIAEDGSIVDLTLWHYVYKEEIEGYSLGDERGSFFTAGYLGDTPGGKIEGKVPMYIKEEGEEPYAVKAGIATFKGCSELVELPKLPSTMFWMGCSFTKGCINLTEFTIPETVTVVGGPMSYPVFEYMSMENPLNVYFEGDTLPDFRDGSLDTWGVVHVTFHFNSQALADAFITGNIMESSNRLG